MKKFTGIMPALITPLTENEELNVPVLKKLIDRHISENADGFYIGGATGEGLALRQDVREALAYEAIKHIDGKVPSIVHIASTDFSEAINLAKQAEKVGAAGISAIPPIFFAYDEDDVFNYYKKIAESVSIPLIVYFNPNAGVNFTPEMAARIFEIDNVTGIKWTNPNFFGMNMLKQLTHGEMNIINGPDEMLLMGLNAGADGGIGSTYNFMLPKIKAVYNNFIAGNGAEAMNAQNEVNKIIHALLKYKVIPGVKVILEKQGYEVGNAAFPQKRYTEEEKEILWNKILEAGL